MTLDLATAIRGCYPILETDDPAGVLAAVGDPADSSQRQERRQR